MTKKDPLDDDHELAEVLQGLVHQNYSLGQCIIGLQTTCAALIREICSLSPDPGDAMVRFNAQLTGIAAGVADRFNKLQIAEGFDTSDMTATIETITQLAEESATALGTVVGADVKRHLPP